MSLSEKYADEIAQFTRVTGRLAANGYVTGYGGNAAWKLEDDLIMITPTMLNKGEITSTDVVFINMAGDTVEGTRRPTGERPMYIKFFNDRPDIRSVIHCHAPNVGAFAIMEGENLLMRPFFPETSHEVGPVPVVPYAEPLTQQLADNFEPFIRKYNSFIMENHGLVTMSSEGIDYTMMNVELLEASACSILKALAARRELKELSREAIEGLDNVMKQRNCPMFGAPGVYESLVELYF
ncbi:MAG: class II aldolase/adducin family protein [Lentisphaerae bacterium]|jgi:L-fuculose-phosphate aldolase|nr:class II aldolase/adducin family protein [Verrucomicrobiota bacterium]MBT4818894.1 class II aldolase/adducin family protein [Lentisphaerota bacterium]MBT5609724.1 class II aldolase/adducin family protein [Lentisphaerota bacterium]MBT7068677.1 class II aldolase/adducin family protein [Verrucomicrobiota bacterium]MBT7847596.1 class II aldolase/adducin family protein [Lentisphaerota bacterium]